MGYTCDSSRHVLWDIHVIPRGLCYGIIHVIHNPKSTAVH